MTENSAGTAIAPSNLMGLSGADSGQAAMVKMAVEVAQQYPRDEALVLSTALKTLRDHPEQAKKSLYSIPYEDRRGGTTTRVEGLSIRAAESLSSLWRHLRVGVRISGEDKDGYDLEAMAWDMQSNSWLLLPYRVSKWEAPRGGGGAMLLGEQRMLQRLQAGISKVRRNVTLAMIPAHIKAAYEKQVREIIAGGPLTARPAEAKLKDMLADFGQFTIADGVTVGLPHLEAYVGKAAAEWTGQDLSELRALFTALEDGMTTVAEAFGGGQPTETGPSGPTTVRPETINQGEARGRNKPPPQTRRPAASARAAQDPAAEPAPATEAAKPAGLSAEELQTALDTIQAQTTEDGLDALQAGYLQAGGLFKRAAGQDKVRLMDAFRAKRAEVTTS